MCGECFETFDPNLSRCPHCGCGNKYQFFDIDNGMIPIIQQLNRKGYKTVMCCEGHTDRQGFKSYKHIGIQILFNKQYDIDICGAEWKKVTPSIYGIGWSKRIETKTKKMQDPSYWYDELESWRQDMLKKIENCVKNLPVAY